MAKIKIIINVKETEKDTETDIEAERDIETERQISVYKASLLKVYLPSIRLALLIISTSNFATHLLNGAPF
jgi:hypothetical protein